MAGFLLLGVKENERVSTRLQHQKKPLSNDRGFFGLKENVKRFVVKN